MITTFYDKYFKWFFSFSTTEEHKQKTSSLVRNLPSKTSSTARRALETLSGIGLAWVLSPVRVYTHEAAHACVMSILFNNTHPEIILHNFGYSGGACEWGLNEALMMSDLGQMLAYDTSLSLVAAAGPLINILTSLFLAATQSNLANGISCSWSMHVVTYAINDFVLINNDCLGSDFCTIAEKSGLNTYLLMGAIGISASIFCYYRTVKSI